MASLNGLLLLLASCLLASFAFSTGSCAGVCLECLIVGPGFGANWDNVSRKSNWLKACIASAAAISDRLSSDRWDMDLFFGSLERAIMPLKPVLSASRVWARDA